jgi:PKD repeat protein
LLSANSGFSNYAWSNGASGTSTYASLPGYYYVSATDSLGCPVHSDTINLNSGSVTHLSITENSVQNTASFNASIAGLSSYVWNMGNGTVFTDSASYLTYVYPDTGTYTVQLITQQNCGADTTSTVVHITFPLSVLNLNGESLSVSVIPNPFHDATLITISKSQGEYEAHLYSIDGRLIRNYGKIQSNLTIERGDLGPGEYFIHLLNPNFSRTLKLTVQ